MRGQEEGTSLDGPFRSVAREVVTRLHQEQGRAVAVFDADGTLWGDDLGERHLRVLEARELVTPSPGYGSVIEEYEARCREDTDAGYSWAVTSMAGLHEGDAVGTAVLAWAAHRHLVPQAIRDLFTWLGSLEIEVWLVSASNRWAIETAAAELGVPPERVIAMSMDVVDGQLGGAAHRPLCNGAGKAELIEQRIGEVPLLAVGNSRHDMAMLRQAELGVVVRLSGAEGELPAVCPELRASAQVEGWFELDLRWDEDTTQS
jgi:phosphoserine phosphatase